MSDTQKNKVAEDLSEVEPETAGRLKLLLEWLKAKVDVAVLWMMPGDVDPLADDPLPIARRSIKIGLWSFFLLFGVFGIWSATAPLDSAAVAQGTVVLESSQKTIQHLEGGIIEEILVTEGVYVEAGQPLIKLSETAAKARLDLVEGQYLALKGREARLLAVRDEKEKIAFPELLTASEKPSAKDVLDNQTRLFSSNNDVHQGKLNVLGKRIDQYKEEVSGLQSQVESTRKQLTLINEEVSVVKKLLEQGNAAKPRLLALQRNAADLQGQLGEYIALIARAEQSISQTEEEIINTKSDYLQKTLSELREVQEQLATVTEQYNAAADISERLVLVAPEAGIIKGLRFHTRGGVIKPGEAVMDIIPQDDRLIVEAQVLPGDIDLVHKGLEARVRLTAYKTRNIPPVEGRVKHVSPDRFVDDKNGQSYYKARIEISEEQLAALQEVDLYPGMQTDVLIVTGSQTLLRYLFSPITDSFFRAMREQ